MIRWIPVVLVCAAFCLSGQNYYSPNLREQCIAIMPLTGRGTAADPLRPLWMPDASQKRGEATSIESYTWRMSDDKKSAIVYLYARDTAAFQSVLREPRVKAFVKGRDKRDAVEREVRAVSKDFSLEDAHGLRGGK